VTRKNAVRGLETMPKATKLYDLTAALPLVVLYFFGIAALVSKLTSEWADLIHSFTAALALDVAYQIATIVFLGMMLTLFVIRRPPQSAAKGVLPRAAGFIGATLQLLFLALPRVENGFAVLAASTAVTVTGLAASIYAAGFLGRSFSIFPQARGSW
jgi:hypothetical protein